MNIRLLLFIYTIIIGIIESKADNAHYNWYISQLDSLHVLSEEAFNDRCFEEAMKYEGIIGELIPKDISLLPRVIKNRSDLSLYAAQCLPIDSVWMFSQGLLDGLYGSKHSENGEFKVLQLRTTYYNSLRENGDVNDSIAETVPFQIKQLYGGSSTEYAEALLLKSVILLRSIPSSLEYDYSEYEKMKSQKLKEAERLINHAISIYKKRKMPREWIWFSYALSLKETVIFEKKWRWHGYLIKRCENLNEIYGIASNVRNEACAQANAIYQGILRSSDTRGIPDAINALENLVEVQNYSRGNTSFEVRTLILASFLSNIINNISKAKSFYDRAVISNDLCYAEPKSNESVFNHLFEEIGQNELRLNDLVEGNPLRGFEEALLTIGSPKYDVLRFFNDESDKYWFNPTLDVKDKDLNFSNLIRELIIMFSGSPFLNKDFLSQFGLSYIKEEIWNSYIEHPVPRYSIIWEAHGDEIYYFDNLNTSLGYPLTTIYDSIIGKKNKSYEDYENLSRCCFYLYDFSNAAIFCKKALDLLFISEPNDVKKIMTFQKNYSYLLMLDLWYDLWLLSNATRTYAKENEQLERKMMKKCAYLKKHPELLQKKLEKLKLSAQSFSYDVIPYLYNNLSKLDEDERMELWKEFSAWFYSIIPMLSFTSGMEEVMYDVQLFSKGLLLETSQTSSPIQRSWKDVKNSLKSDEVAIEFLKSGNGYCALVIYYDSNRPEIIPLFSEYEYDLFSEDFELYLSSSGYDLILAPLDLRDNISTIYFSPVGILNTVSIESLFDKCGVLASDKWNFIRLSSTKVLCNSPLEPTIDHIALYGGLDYNHRSFDGDKYSVENCVRVCSETKDRFRTPQSLRFGVDSLKWSFPEISLIKDLWLSKYPSCKISFFTSDRGVEETIYLLQEHSPSIIHLSTHGFYWTEEDIHNRSYISFIERASQEDINAAEKAMFYSGLFLSGANIALSGESLPEYVEDGVLTANELSKMNLSQTDFVVLSACQTGLGSVRDDGVFGLQRGFKLAGVNTLLMSLWPVHDKATQLLMIEFYKHMLRGEKKFSALNLAKKYVMNYSDEEYDFSDPEFWAGWILLDALD